MIENSTSEQLDRETPIFHEVVTINNCEVHIISQEHFEKEDHELNQDLVELIEDEQTKVIVVEYFLPELLANAEASLILPPPWKKNAANDNELLRKTAVSEAISIHAKKLNKIIAVTDTANKPEYYTSWAMPLFLLLLATGIHEPIFSNMYLFLLGLYGVNRFDQFIGTAFKKSGLPTTPTLGIFDEEVIRPVENIILDLEDSRRIMIALGILQLAGEYQGTKVDPYKIVVAYPRAHAIRIHDYLQSKNTLVSLLRSIKTYYYKLLPFVDKSVRQYKWSKVLAALSGKPSNSSWRMISNRQLFT